MIEQSQSLGAVEDLQRGLDLLDQVRRRERGTTLRIYRPEPTMAFGQRDARLPGFERARQAAESHGFAALVRKAGGRAMPYHRGCLVVDWIEADSDAVIGSRRRFAEFGSRFSRLLTELGVPAGVGEIPGEYCPGEFSVHGGIRLGHQVKLVGTAQRVVSGAWLFSSAIVIEDAAPLRLVLTDCYAALGLNWDPATVGAAADFQPDLTVAEVKAAVLDWAAPAAVG